MRLEYDQAPAESELKEVRDTQLEQPSAGLEQIFDHVDMVDGIPVIRFDLNEAAEQAFQIQSKSEVESPDPKPPLDDVEKPGDGVSLDTSGVPAEENEFALDENILWSDLEPVEMEPAPSMPNEDDTAEEDADNQESIEQEDATEESNPQQGQVPVENPPEDKSEPNDLDRFFTWEE